MKLRDNVGLLAEAAELIQYARGPFGKMYTAEDVAGRILDAVDRALAAPSPETGGAHVQPTAMPPGYVGSAGVATLAPAVPAPEPCPSCKSTTKCDCDEFDVAGAMVEQHPIPSIHTPGMTFAAPAAEPGKPVTCEYGTTGATIYCIHCDTERDLVSIMETNPLPRPSCAPAGVWTEEEIERSRKAADGYRDVFPDPAAQSAEPGKPAVTLRCQEFCTRCGSPGLPSVVCECPCHASRATPEKGGR